MSKLQKQFFILICMCVCGIFSVVQGAHALDVEDVRFGVHPNKVRMVLDISEVSDFRAFVLDNPYRMVVDLPYFDWKAGRTPKPAQAKIRDIRQGRLNKTAARIVFDLEQPAIIETAFLLPAQGEHKNRIVIDYKFVSASEFKAGMEMIHGTLDIDDPVISAEERVQVVPDKKPNVAVVKKPLVIIDPGHGGKDPGAHSKNQIYEKHVVLALAKELRQQLLESGKYRVLMTRETDVYIRLKDRVKFARDHGGDLFVSIHADSIHKSDVHGTSIYTISKKASDAQTARLAEKENQSDLMAGLDLSIDDEQVAFILGDFLMNDTMNQSKFFANTLVSKLKHDGIYMLENPHRYAGFAVLKAPDIPSVLIEAGFMSNANEARLLNQPGHRSKLAAAIMSGVDAYFTYAHDVER